MRSTFTSFFGLLGTGQLRGSSRPGDTLPARRAGQWDIRMQMEGREGGPEILARVCTDAATERLLMAHAMGGMGLSCPSQ